MAGERERWTPEEFTSFCVALLGTTYGWQRAIAKRLGVTDRSIRRWARTGGGGPPPNVVAELTEMARIVAGRRMGFPCRDEWIVGDGPAGPGGRRREYIVHTTPPRFIARAVIIDEVDGTPEPVEAPVDDEAGVVYRVAANLELCEIEWIDPVPRAPEITALMEAAGDAIDEAGE